MSYDLVAVTDLDASPVFGAYYGRRNFLAWARKLPRPFPYPYVLARFIDGAYYIDEEEAESHILDLWDVVHQHRLTGELPDWWQWLIDHRNIVWVYGHMLDHLDDIAERQRDYEESGELPPLP